jgi:hypothetical protein
MAGPTTLFQTGVHGSRPAASAGCVLYSCTTHSLIYRSDGSSWTTFLTIPTGSGVATDPIWDAAGDLAVGSGADTAAKLSIGATNGMAVQRVSGAVAWALPAGYEFDYAQTTSGGTISATTEGAANTIVTANAVTYDGSTVVMVEVFLPQIYTSTTLAEDLFVALFDGSSSIGTLLTLRTTYTGRMLWGGTLVRRLTPSAASHTYSVRAYVPSNHSGGWDAGAGGAGTIIPAYIRQTKV